MPLPDKMRFKRWIGFAAVPVLIVIGIVVLWQWDWFIPQVEARASAALGRPVVLGHLHVRPGRVTVVTADDVRVENPAGFPAGPPLAQLAHVTVQLDVMRYIRRRAIAIPLIAVDRPQISAVATADGANNYSFSLPGGGASEPSLSAPQIERLTIEDGHAHVLIPRLKTDFTMDIATRAAETPQLVVDAKGTYAGQPVTGKLISGIVLALEDTIHPFPIDLRLAHGSTTVSLVGTLQDPIHVGGANLKLALAGADMADLYPLTGISMPTTTGYKVTSQLAYADRKLGVSDIAGVVGNTDLEGSIAVDPGKSPAKVTADLHSRRVNLADFGGVIGSQPGSAGGANQNPEQRQAVARAEASPKLLPDRPIYLPRLRGTDMHVQYRGEHIEGRSIPFDTFDVRMDMVDGRIILHPVSLGVGTGQITGTINLDPKADDTIHTTADIRLQRVDVSRLMAATHVFSGAGHMGGEAKIDATGNSLAAMLAHSDGSVDVYMIGGNLSALLVDLAGLEFGKAMLSALGIPEQTDVACLIGQFALQQGVLSTRTLLLDTSQAVISGSGTIDLGTERLNYQLKTKSKHFTIASLPAPIGIGGTFKNPSIGPDLASLGARGGAATGLGILAAPLALLPTIQFGVGDADRCGPLLSGTHK
ncbi:MAG TPA: AsmA family protein [Acetobacteraceae bacterium]